MSVFGAGVTVFIAVAAIAAMRAAPLTVSAGMSAAADACPGGAAIGYATAFSPHLPGYVISRVTITSRPACANRHYELNIADRHHHRALAQGWLDENGAASPNVIRGRVEAASVVVSLVITV